MLPLRDTCRAMVEPVERDPDFAKTLLDEAATLSPSDQPEAARLILRGLDNTAPPLRTTRPADAQTQHGQHSPHLCCGVGLAEGIVSNAGGSGLTEANGAGRCHLQASVRMRGTSPPTRPRPLAIHQPLCWICRPAKPQRLGQLHLGRALRSDATQPVRPARPDVVN